MYTAIQPNSRLCANGEALPRLDRHDAHAPRADVGEDLAQRGQVEHVAEALARGLEQDGERRVGRGDVEEAGRALALLPQRCALAGTAAGEQQRARRVLAEARGEQRRGRHAGDDQLVELVGVDEQHLERDLLERLREPADDAVVGPEHLHGQVEARQAFLDRERPRRVHAGAERREDADAPVADLVGEALDHDGAVVGDRAGRLGLLVEVGAQVRGGARVETFVAELRLGIRAREVAQLAHERAQRASELERAAGPIASPERRLGPARRARA